jgi:hypothetical protein
MSYVWQTKGLRSLFLDVWQAKGLRVNSSDVWQGKELERSEKDSAPLDYAQGKLQR